MAIVFFSEDVPFLIKSKMMLRDWIKESVSLEQKHVKEINYIFCSDEYLLQINQNYLNHDTFTDIITFDYDAGKNILSGDIYISIDRVKENAVLYNASFADELLRVFIHGVLHLMGYNDKNESDKVIMTSKEDTYIALYKNKYRRSIV